MYSSPASEVMKTKAISAPEAADLAASKSESLSEDLTSEPAAVARSVMASMGWIDISTRIVVE
jgi:hypothetical protein